MANTNSTIMQEFLIESFEGLSSINEELSGYEKNPNDKELLNSIFRKVHTLKGSSSFLGLKKLQGITHSAEGLLDFIRGGVLGLNADMVDVLLQCFDSCLEILKNIEKDGKEGDKDYQFLSNKLSSLLEQKTAISEKVNGTGAKVFKELLAQDQPDKNIKPNPKPLEKSEIISPVAPEGDPNNDGPGVKANSLTDSVVRINVHLLDKIMNVVGELVLNRNQILQYANVEDKGDLNRLAQRLNIITTELQTDIMTTRMQPVGSVLVKFERIVRDLARGQNKKIKLDIIGKDTELDKTLLEAIRDPLTHLIRNSVDHGIELPQVRKSNGKNEEGKIVIKSYHEGGQVIIEIKDDGNGINPQKILEKALQKGTVTPEQGAKMSARQILNIIFMPGFSTAEQVTNISGRGVGMDVVKSNIEKIGGSVDIISAIGEGTTFKLKIPLTLAIVPALVIQDKNERFAIPQINLVELVRLEGEESKKQLETLHQSEFIRLRGNLIPIFRLSESLKLKMDDGGKTDDDFISIVVLNAEGRQYGLIVDAILDTEEIVVKPLSKKLKNISLFAGATIMGDGRVALIIDALGFFNSVDRGHGQKTDHLLNENKADQSFTGEEQEVLLCSLGDNHNYGIPLMMVNRLEEFKSENIEWSGEQPLIKYGKIPMPLLNLEKTLKLKGSSLLEKFKNDESVAVPCVVVKVRDNFYGLVVDSIKDIAVSEGGISSDSIDREGILGTVFVTQKTISLIDIYSIVEMQKLGKNLLSKKEKKDKGYEANEGGGGRILVIDDSPLYRKVIKDFLEDCGFEVWLAINGKEGIVTLDQEKHLDLVILDIEMPVMDGWEFASEVRSSAKKYSKIPIVALSSKLTNVEREKGVKIGFNHYLEKLNKDEVLKTIKNYIKPGKNHDR